MLVVKDPRAFADRDALDAWLRANHQSADELWVRLFKKATGRATVSWEDVVEIALCWGWIDGQRRSFDDESFVQRLSPRRARSMWSTKNRETALRLIAEGRMQPAGQAHVTAAQADGRWEQAYAGVATMELPEDFLRALDAVPEARAQLASLKRSELFSIYHGLQTARRADTRAKRIAKAIESLRAKAEGSS